MSSQVIELKELKPAIIQIRMQDRANKNTFSDELAQGLIDAFQMINNQVQYKVVILTGYDSYFSSGGTQEALMAIFEGRAKFTDTDLYSLALNCPVPVISAMQGHGIGGGFVMGLFADFVSAGSFALQSFENRFLLFAICIRYYFRCSSKLEIS